MTVANNHRYRSDVQALSRFIQGGELGKTVGVRAGAYHFKRPSEGWRYRRAESGGGAFLDHGVPLLDLALWLADYPEPVRVTAHMDRGRGASAVEDSMIVQLECAGGQSFLFDVSSAYVGEEERWWFEVLAARGSARLAPLRVVKELNGRATNVSPSGAAGRESAFNQSYRAELAHFLAVVRGETEYEAAERPGRAAPDHRSDLQVGRGREGSSVLSHPRTAARPVCAALGAISPRSRSTRTPARSRCANSPACGPSPWMQIVSTLMRMSSPSTGVTTPSRTMRIARRTASSASWTCASGRLRDTSDPSLM